MAKTYELMDFTVGTEQVYDALDDVTRAVDKVQRDAKVQIDIDDSKIASSSAKARSKIKGAFKGLPDAEVGVDVNVDTSGAEKEVDDFIKKSEKKEVTIPTRTAPSKAGGGGGGLLSGLGGGSSLIAGAMGGGIALAGQKALEFLNSAIDMGTEYNNAIKTMSAKTGVFGEELKKLKDIGNTVFKQGIGESMAEALEIVGTAKQQIGDAFNDEELTTFTVGAGRLAKTFDKDVNEIIFKSTPLIKQFGLSGKEAFDLVALSMQKGGSAQDDILDSLGEYSQLVKLAGYDAQQFVGILTTGTEAGVFNTDKMVDSIKEAQIRINAGDYRSAFKDLTDSADSGTKAIIQEIEAIVMAGESGQKSVAEVMKESSQLIDENVSSGAISESLATKMQVAIAGTPAEDLGVELYSKIFSADISSDSVTEMADKVGGGITEAMKMTPLQSLSKGFESAMTKIGSFLIDLTNKVMEFLQPLINLYKVFYEEILMGMWRGIKPLIDSFGELWEAVQKLFGSMGEGGGVVEFVTNLFRTLGKIVGVVWTVLIRLSTFFIKIWVKTITTVVNVISSLVGWFKQLYESGGFVKDMLDWIYTAFMSVVGAITDTIVAVLEFLGLLDAPVEVDVNVKAKKKTTTEDTDGGDGAKEGDVKGDLIFKNGKWVKKEKKKTTTTTTTTPSAIVQQPVKIVLSEYRKFANDLEKMLDDTINTTVNVQDKIDKQLTDRAIKRLQTEKKAIEESTAITGVEKIRKTAEIEKQISDIQLDESLRRNEKELQNAIDTEVAKKDAMISAYAKRIAELKDIEEKTTDKKSSEYLNAVANREQLEREFAGFKENIQLQTSHKLLVIEELYAEKETDIVQQHVLNRAEFELAVAEKLEAEKKKLRGEEMKKFEDAVKGLDSMLQSIKPPEVDDTDVKKRSKELDQQRRDMERGVKLHKLTYEQYTDEMAKLDEENTKLIEDSSKNRVSSAQELADTLLSSFSVVQQYLDTEFADSLTKVADSIVVFDEESKSFTLDFANNTEEMSQLMGKAGAEIGSMLVSALETTENVGQALLLTLIGIVEKTLLILAPEIIALFGTWIQPVWVGIATGTAVVSGLTAMLELAKSSIGAETGGLIDGNFSKKKGQRDTIPMWVESGEYIVKKSVTSKNEGLLSWMNAGKNPAEYPFLNTDVTVEKFNNMNLRDAGMTGKLDDVKFELQSIGRSIERVRLVESNAVINDNRTTIVRQISRQRKLYK